VQLGKAEVARQACNGSIVSEFPGAKVAEAVASHLANRKPHWFTGIDPVCC